MDCGISGADQLAGRNLCRFYTKPKIGSLLIRLFGASTPRRVVDLGTGNGCLAAAAAKRWHNAKIVTVDVDPDCVGSLTEQMSKFGANRHQHFILDALDFELPTALSGGDQGFDAALCNPPYIKPKWRPAYDRILEHAGLAKAYQCPTDVSIDALFLAQVMRLTKPGGRIGLIVPDTLITGKKSRSVRHTLLTNHRVEEVVQLPRHSFCSTDAQAFLIVFRKLSKPAFRIRLSTFPFINEHSTIIIDREQAIERMDFSYHSRAGSVKFQGRSLEMLNAEIVRGKINSAQAKNMGSLAFHTTDFPRITGNGVCLRDSNCKALAAVPNASVIAQPGDILVARVGRSLHRKITHVIGGQAAITDCVLRIRLESSLREQVLTALVSDEGNQLLASITRGVSAQMISMVDLFKLPLPLTEL